MKKKGEEEGGGRGTKGAEKGEIREKGAAKGCGSPQRVCIYSTIHICEICCVMCVLCTVSD